MPTNTHLAPEMTSFGVANLRNSAAITCDPRLESEHFRQRSFAPVSKSEDPGFTDMPTNTHLAPEALVEGI
jgi:hypothetical protein